MAPGSEPKQDRSRVTRQRILEAAVESLATRGWEASSVTVIATDAGVSRGALQHHFRTREDLFLASLEHMFHKRAELLATVAAPQLSGVARVEYVVRSVVDFYVGTLFNAALQVWTAAASEPELRDRIQPLERRLDRSVHETTVRLLGVDGSDRTARSLIQATLDLARGLALADVLADDSTRRAGIIEAWSAQLAVGLGLVSE